MRDALLKGCTHLTEAVRPQPSGYTPINAQNIVRDFGGRRQGPSRIRRHMGEAGVGGMGRQLGSAAWRGRRHPLLRHELARLVRHLQRPGLYYFIRIGR